MSKSPQPNYDDFPQPEFKNNRGDYYDISGLLSFAEELKRNCDRYVEKIEALVSIQNYITLIAITIFFLSSTFIFIEPAEWIYESLRKFSSIDRLILIVLLGVGASIYLISLLFYLQVQSTINKFLRKIISEEVALEKTVELLREMGSVMVAEKEWNQFKLIEFQIRLSRFDIGRYRPPKSLLSHLIPASSKK